MDPSDNAIQVAPEDTQEIITYYSTCVGTNPIEEPLIEAYNYTKLLNTTIYELSNPNSAYCPGDPYLLSCYDNLDSIFASLDTVSNVARCEPIKDEWDDVLNDATCDSMFYGLLDLWAGQYWTISMLILLMISGAITYKYFDVWFDDEDTSLFNSAFTPSTSANRQREKSINLGSSRGTSLASGSTNTGAGAPGVEEVAYSTAFLYDDTPRKDDASDESKRKFVF